MLPPSVDGLDVIELGCGTAYVSSWLARRGARPVGIDNSTAQLETARRLQAEFGVEFPLHLVPDGCGEGRADARKDALLRER